MKKTNCLFSILLVIVFLSTSIGAVSAEEPPPPLDGQTLPAPTLNPNYPNNGWWLDYTYGINFNWSDVPGADKYVLEIQRNVSDYFEFVNAIPPLTISSKNGAPPPTVATVATKKPFLPGVGLNGYQSYRWRVTAFNTDVGADPAGTGQTSAWDEFSISERLYNIIDMFPGSYSGVIDYKKGDGTHSPTPNLNWVVDHGGSLLGNDIDNNPAIKFKITLSEGKNKYTKTIAATAANCSDYTFSDTLLDDAVCYTSLSGFTPDLAALAPRTSYTWEIVTFEQPDPTLFPNPAPIMPAARDTLQYNPVASYPALNALVTDTTWTNKPTFRWNNPVGSLPDSGGYQLVVEGYDLTKSSIVWKPVNAPTIVPGRTKIPGTNTIACPINGDECKWYFKTPLNPNFRYRWNVRILASGKYYGPWANPGIPGIGGDLVRDQNGDDIGSTLIYETIVGWFNYFHIFKKPILPIVIQPGYKHIDSDPTPDLQWWYSYIYSPSFGATVVDTYSIDLIRLSPAPLTKTISALKSCSSGEIAVDFNKRTINTAALLPTEYSAFGLPRGVYQFTITPKIGPISGQPYFTSPPVKSVPSIFTVAPAPPTISGASYNPTTKKMSVTFNKDTSAPAASVKYRMMVKMKYGSLWRWVKIGTYAGTSCTEAGGTSCTIEFFAYKPGTRNALESGEYRVNIQEALKEEGVSKKWGPFGNLSAGDGTLVSPPW